MPPIASERTQPFGNIKGRPLRSVVPTVSDTKRLDSLLCGLVSPLFRQCDSPLKRLESSGSFKIAELKNRLPFRPLFPKSVASYDSTNFAARYVRPRNMTRGNDENYKLAIEFFFPTFQFSSSIKRNLGSSGKNCYFY